MLFFLAIRQKFDNDLDFPRFLMVSCVFFGLFLMVEKCLRYSGRGSQKKGR